MSTLLCEEVVVRIKPVDRDEYSQPLTVKVTRASSNSGSVTIELTSDSDLFFYYSLKVTDTDFHSLKNDQRLLVDFHQFPGMIKELLDPKSHMSVALAVDPISHDGTFSVIEANHFRELTHLSLKLRRGNDESVKTYLAGRLSHFKTVTADMESALSAVRQELRRAQLERDAAQADISRARSEHDQLVSSVQANYMSKVAQLNEDHAREIRDIHLSTSSEHSSETRRLYEDARERDLKMRDLEKRAEETRITLASVESSFRTSQTRVASLERELDVGREQVKRMEADNRSLMTQNYGCEKRIAELTVEVSALTQQLNAKEALVHNTAQLADQSTGQCKQLEYSLSSSRASMAQFGDRVRELENAISHKDSQLSKLQVKNKELKLMVKQTQQALLQQEQVVLSLTRELTEERGRLGLSQVEKEGERGRIAQLNEQVSILRTQLTDSHNLLESNSQVIAYLNKKLSDRDHLGLFGSGMGSELKFAALPPMSTTQQYLPRSSSSQSVLNSTAITTPAIPEYPNRSQLLNSSDVSGIPDRAPTPSLSRVMSGPIRFTARTGSLPVLK